MSCTELAQWAIIRSFSLQNYIHWLGDIEPSFHTLPYFYLPFVFTIIHGRGRSVKNRETWKHSMTSGGCQVGEGGEGPNCQNNTLDNISHVLYCSFGLQTLAWSKLLILTRKILTFKFSTLHICEYQPLPLMSTLRLLTWWTLSNLPKFLLVFHSRVLLWTQTEGINGGGLGTKLLAVNLCGHALIPDQ